MGGLGVLVMQANELRCLVKEYDEMRAKRLELAVPALWIAAYGSDDRYQAQLRLEKAEKRRREKVEKRLLADSADDKEKRCRADVSSGLRAVVAAVDAARRLEEATPPADSAADSAAGDLIIAGAGDDLGPAVDQAPDPAVGQAWEEVDNSYHAYIAAYKEYAGATSAQARAPRSLQSLRSARPARRSSRRVSRRLAPPAPR